MQIYVNELMLLVFTIKHWKYFHNSKNTKDASRFIWTIFHNNKNTKDASRFKWTI